MKTKRKISKKKILCIVGIISMFGLKYGWEKLYDDDITHDLNRAQKVLTEIKTQLDTEDLNPGERHELHLTYNAIHKEFNDLIKKQEKARKKAWFVRGR